MHTRNDELNIIIAIAEEAKYILHDIDLLTRCVTAIDERFYPLSVVDRSIESQEFYNE